MNRGRRTDYVWKISTFPDGLAGIAGRCGASQRRVFTDIRSRSLAVSGTRPALAVAATVAPSHAGGAASSPNRTSGHFHFAGLIGTTGATRASFRPGCGNTSVRLSNRIEFLHQSNRRDDASLDARGRSGVSAGVDRLFSAPSHGSGAVCGFRRDSGSGSLHAGPTCGAAAQFRNLHGQTVNGR